MGDNSLGLGDGFAFLGAVFGDKRLGLFAQPSRLVELAAYTGSPCIEAAGKRAARRPEQQDDKDYRRDENPEFGVVHEFHQAARAPAARLTALLIAAASGAAPVSFSTSALPTSAATLRISPSACSLLAAMRDSAASICDASAEASWCWRSAASAASRSLVWRSVSCAVARASASAFW